MVEVCIYIATFLDKVVRFISAKYVDSIPLIFNGNQFAC